MTPGASQNFLKNPVQILRRTLFLCRARVAYLSVAVPTRAPSSSLLLTTAAAGTVGLCRHGDVLAQLLQGKGSAEIIGVRLLLRVLRHVLALWVAALAGGGLAAVAGSWRLGAGGGGGRRRGGWSGGEGNFLRGWGGSLRTGFSSASWSRFPRFSTSL